MIINKFKDLFKVSYEKNEINKNNIKVKGKGNTLHFYDSNNDSDKDINNSNTDKNFASLKIEKEIFKQEIINEIFSRETLALTFKKYNFDLDSINILRSITYSLLEKFNSLEINKDELFEKIDSLEEILTENDRIFRRNILKIEEENFLEFKWKSNIIDKFINKYFDDKKEHENGYIVVSRINNIYLFMKKKFLIIDLIEEFKKWNIDDLIDFLKLILNQLFFEKLIKFTNENPHYYIESTEEIFELDYLNLKKELNDKLSRNEYFPLRFILNINLNKLDSSKPPESFNEKKFWTDFNIFTGEKFIYMCQILRIYDIDSLIQFLDIFIEKNNEFESDLISLWLHSKKMKATSPNIYLKDFLKQTNN